MMAVVTFPSLDDAEIIEVEFLTLSEASRPLKLLVDSGFTGKSSLVLGVDAYDLVRAQVPGSQAAGALQGTQHRGWVTCSVAPLSFQCTLIAIFTDLSPLALPPGVHGMAGLNFLRHFTRWGAERAGDGWRFFLATGDDGLALVAP
jgi:hypothetical protein